MLPPLSVTNLDRIASVGSYYIAAAGLLVTLGALIVTAVGFYFSAKQSATLREIEVKQKRLENILELFRIINGVKDCLSNGSPSQQLQLICIENLAEYPEYIEVFTSMRNYYSNNATTHPELLAATERLIKKVRTRSRNCSPPSSKTFS